MDKVAGLQVGRCRHFGPIDERAVCAVEVSDSPACVLPAHFGVFPGNDLRLATLASPIAHVSAGDPPFLLVHGLDDELVPVSHARRMVAALRQVGTPASVLELRGVGHGFVGLATGIGRIRLAY